MSTGVLAHFNNPQRLRIPKAAVYALSKTIPVFCTVYGLFSFFIGDHHDPAFPYSFFWTVEAICSGSAACLFFYSAIRNKYADPYMQLCQSIDGMLFYGFRNNEQLPIGAIVRIDKLDNGFFFRYALAKVNNIDASDPSRMILVHYAYYINDHYQLTKSPSVIPPNEYKNYKLISNRLTEADLEKLYCDRRSDNA